MPVAGGVLGALAVAAASFALISTLPPPSEDERLAVRVLEVLARSGGGGAVLHVGGRAVVASCRRLPGRKRLVMLGDGERLVLQGTQVRSHTMGARAVARARPRHAAELLAVKADLAGSHSLYATALRARLARGGAILGGLASFRGVPAYRIRLGADRPQVELLVARRTLAPLAARYRSRRVTAWSRLLPARGRPGC